LEGVQQRLWVRLVPVGVLDRHQDADVLLETGETQRRPGRRPQLGRRHGHLHAGGDERGQHGVHSGVPTDQPHRVGVVPLQVVGIELVRVLRGNLLEGADQRLPDPPPDPHLVLRGAEHGGEGVLVGGDDEADRVDQGPVEVEDDDGPAGGFGEHVRDASATRGALRVIEGPAQTCA